MILNKGNNFLIFLSLLIIIESLNTVFSVEVGLNKEFSTIQDGLDEIRENENDEYNDLILDDGIYKGPGNNNLKIKHDIKISARNPGKVLILLTDEDEGNVFRFIQPIKVSISGVKFESIKKTSPLIGDGGFISAYNLKSLKIRDCYFRNGIAFNGGAIYADNSGLDIKNSNFFHNTAMKHGGGIYYKNHEKDLDVALIKEKNSFNFNKAGQGDKNIYLDIIKNQPENNNNNYDYYGRVGLDYYREYKNDHVYPIYGSNQGPYKHKSFEKLIKRYNSDDGDVLKILVGIVSKVVPVVIKAANIVYKVVIGFIGWLF